MMQRAAGRRLVHAGLASGWEAWIECWDAKRDALYKLRKVWTLALRPLADADMSVHVASLALRSLTSASTATATSTSTALLP